MEKVPFTSEVKKLHCREGLRLWGSRRGFECQGAPQWMLALWEGGGA